MTMGRGALLGACLALPLMAGAAGAAQPDGGRYIYLPPGAMVIVLPGPGVSVMPHQTLAAPADFPVAHMIAEQQSMIRSMMADMDSMMAMPMPDPQQMIRSVMQGMPQVAPGSGIVMTSMSSGNGTCLARWTDRRDPDDARAAAGCTGAGRAAPRQAVDNRLSAASGGDRAAAADLRISSPDPHPRPRFRPGPSDALAPGRLGIRPAARRSTA